jgi:hypothetical protein
VRLQLSKAREDHLSHISRLELEIQDLEDLKRACSRLGVDFIENQKTFRWYGGTKECECAIRVSGATYEIGVVRESNRFSLVWDSYRAGGLEAKFGKNAGLLKQAYAVERLRREATLKGYRVHEIKSEAGIRVHLTIH